MDQTQQELLQEIFTAVEGGNHLKETTIVQLMRILKDILYQECNVLELSAPIRICGDIHGQLFDLFKLFEKAGEGDLSKEITHNYLFLGDYVDRGYYSLETFAYLAALKVKYQQKIFLLRGNHESRQVNMQYGFYNDCLQVYGHAGVWSLCNEIFDLLPIAAIVGQKIFCVHGGLSKDIKLVEQLDLLPRRTDLPSQGPLCDLCWSDPEETISEWCANKRGAGWLFGKPQVEEFLNLNNLTHVCRSHQLAMDGYQKYFDNKLTTVWSAPNYMYRAGNKATFMDVDENCNTDKSTMVEFDAHPDSMTRKPDDIILSYFA
ncbi:Ser/Thr protein phosphatase [Tritrichomonas foetus]|uniref:Serine/threonine-protein phosphatase n=1 Tax=Tritrichomonas foetus TaxID=1144522 RepID=A0A1J4JPS7_9EUKA|nr:Ser/Thr protein phosphatase [Tritrichomonas foetus]|eukprot:OHT00762.1 Ser/Thr protein phosphatase [Tritrichomonas foetus]